MASYSIRQDVSVKQALDALIRTASANGDGIDTRGFEAVLVLYHFGITGDTLSATVKVTCALEESSDNSTFTAVAAGDVDGTLQVVDDNTEDEATYVVGYLGSKRYVRPVFTFAGTHTNGIEVASDVILAKPKYAPA